MLTDESGSSRIIYDNKKSFLNFDIELKHGSLFIMAGSSQKYFSHEIPTETKKLGVRYSLTFREVL